MDLAYLATQYSGAEKLRTRIEAHARYSEQTQDFHTWLLPHLDATPGMTVLDAGCGSGVYHRHLAVDDFGLVRSVFPAAEVFVRRDAFVFPDAAAALRYYATFGPDAIIDPPADGSHAAVLLESVARKIGEVIEREGAFRVPKDAGCFVATV